MNKEMCFKCDLPIVCTCNKCEKDDDNIKNKCFCDYCDDFVETAECETVEIADAEENYFEVACNKCYNNLYKKES